MNFRFILKTVSVLLCFMVLLCGLTAAQAQSAGQSKAPATPAKPAAAATPLIDLNSATKQQLMTLPGIGEALSQKIIDGRPYRAKNELTQKKIIPEATYEKISGMIIAKQDTAPATKATPATPSSAAPKAPAASPAKEKSR
jgi:DNA uptake protein ComE-like DNA-binding protein